jgi:hypothetical protein
VWVGFDWIALAYGKDKWGALCKYGNELLSSTKWGEFLEYLKARWILKEELYPRLGYLQLKFFPNNYALNCPFDSNIIGTN